VTRVAYGSLGPRPLLRVDETGAIANAGAPDAARLERLDAMFAEASPSPTSLRAGPDYRLAMLRVLGLRALAAASGRLRAA
jgi:CO/xanthine dehydrogenase FAD-binding subunit